MNQIKITITIPESECADWCNFTNRVEREKQELMDDIGAFLKRNYIESFTIKIEETKN